MMRARIALGFALSVAVLVFSRVTSSVSADAPPANEPTILAVDVTALNDWLGQVDASRLMLHVNTLQSFISRHVNSPKNMPNQGIGAAYRYILGQFEATRTANPLVTVTSQEFNVTWNSVTSAVQNIIMTVPGTDPSAGVIVIGAHYDSISLDPNDGLQFAPGANDNASGVAALIELGRIISPTPHRATLMFVAFTAEEIGCLGSIAFVRDIIQMGQIPVVAMINMDIIGSNSNALGAIDNQHIRLFSEGSGKSGSRGLASKLETYTHSYAADLSIDVQNTLDRPGRYGDHRSFSNAGIPAVRFISAMENNYHQHNSMDMVGDINPLYLQMSTRTVMVALLGLANGLPLI